MITYIRSLYNDGDNNGDFPIFIKDDKSINCHKFVIDYALISKDLYNMEIVRLDHEKKIIDIVFNYIYSETIIQVELNVDQIISLFELIHYLKIKPFILELKNYYSRYFPNTVNLNNWFHTLRSIYGIEKYSDLFDSIVPYIKNVVLLNDDVINNLMIDDMDENIKGFLLRLSLSKTLELNNDLDDALDIDNCVKEKMNNILRCEEEYNEEYNEDTSSNDSTSKKKLKNKKVK